jgi:hypothetical protein
MYRVRNFYIVVILPCANFETFTTMFQVEVFLSCVFFKKSLYFLFALILSECRLFYDIIIVLTSFTDVRFIMCGELE